MAASTPLLLLLDGLLSQDVTRIQEATHQMVIQVEDPWSLLRDPPLLYRVLSEHLRMFPEACKVASCHDGSLPLHFAASFGNVEIAKLILETFPEAASYPNKKGKIPLHYAAREGRTKMVELFLLSAPHTASIPSKKQKLALHFAAGDGHMAVCQSLLQVYPQGASMPSAKGKLPLHFAARWGHLAVAHMLCHVYADSVRALDWEGSLPLHDAAREGQVDMARFLLERFPTGLAIANLRGELPLFPALRSENVDLVILLLQAWPVAAKHVLQNITAEDGVHHWKPEILELMLRAATGQLDSSEMLRGKQPPAIRLLRDTLVDTAAAPDSVAEKNGTRSRLAEPTLVSESQYFPVLETKTRSESPILGVGDETRPRKRRRSHLPNICSSPWSRRIFIPLHASLECGASCHVIRHLLSLRRDDLEKMDDMKRYPLHWAVANCKAGNDEKVDLIRKHLMDPVAARQRDIRDRLPIHVAIYAHADVRIIESLLEVHPTGGVETCQTNDQWHDAMPIYKACHFDCDLSTIYRLLRVDPSIVQQLLRDQHR